MREKLVASIIITVFICPAIVVLVFTYYYDGEHADSEPGDSEHGDTGGGGGGSGHTTAAVPLGKQG